MRLSNRKKLHSGRKKDSKASIYSSEITISSIVVATIAGIGLSSVSANTRGDQKYPNMSGEALNFVYLLIGGLLLAILTRVLYSFLVNRGKRFDIVRADNENDVKPIVIGSVVTFSGVILAQIAVLLTEVGLFQVTTSDVYSYFVFAAVAEEMFYRIGIMGMVQFLISFLLVRMKVERLTADIISLVFAIIVSTTFFTLAHTAYYVSSAFMVATAITSIVLTFGYVVTKHPLVPMLAHMLLNAICAGQFVQIML